MRRFALPGLVAVVAVLGSVIPAATASASPSMATRVFPAAPAPALSVVTRIPLRTQAASTISGIEDNKISCATAKSCLAVGATISNSTGTSAPYARVWNGTAWKSPAVHLPKGISAKGTALTGVACKTATNCLVLGANIANGGTGVTRPFALAWNGTALAPIATPALPSRTSGYLTALSCVTLKNCTGVGLTLTNSGVSRPFVETWNGTKWMIPFVWGASATTLLEFGGISCVSASYCMVSGEAMAATGSVVPYLALWNGKTLTKTAVPVPPGSKKQLINDVSCTSTTNCAATGDSLTASSPSQPLGFAFTENWNGKAWTATKVAWPAGTGFAVLLGISCTHSSAAGRHCIATGATGSGNANSAAALSWDGKTWTLTHVPAPGTGRSSDLEDVSCASAVACVATGQVGATNGTTTSLQAGFWNGTAWTVTAA